MNLMLTKRHVLFLASIVVLCIIALLAVALGSHVLALPHVAMMFPHMKYPHVAMMFPHMKFPH